MPISGPRMKRRNKGGTARLNRVVRLIDKLRADLAASKGEMNPCVPSGPAMTDLEDLRHLVEQNHKQIQRQLKHMQEHIDVLHAERHSESLGNDSHRHGVLSHCYGWRRHFGTFLWTLAIVGLVFGCAWNLRELLQDMIESPTVTKMTFNLRDKLPLPPISVYQKGDFPMLHAERIFKALENGSLTKAYLEAIMKGFGIGFYPGRNITVQPSEITEAYKEAILRYGSLTEAGLAFYKEYGIACSEQFSYCKENLHPEMNCCDIFEFLWGFNGPQYSLKGHTILIDAFRAFSLHLRSLANIEALQKGYPVEDPGSYQSFLLGIDSGVDQTTFNAHRFAVQPSDSFIITIRQKSRNLKVSKDCVDLPPKLRYFRDYTIYNCFFERCYLDKIPLCNISCEIPLLQLMNPDNFKGPPCEFDVFNSTCREIISANHRECSTNHGCLFPCNYTEVEYSVTKELPSTDPRKIQLYFQYDTTDIQTFEDTSRLTFWECLGLISSVLDLWLGITIFSLYRLLFRNITKVLHFKAYFFGNNNLTAAHSASAYQQQEMATVSNRE